MHLCQHICLKNHIISAYQILSLEVKIGNSTNFDDAIYSDSADFRNFDINHRVTLWCLQPVYGKHVFIYREGDYPQYIYISEVFVY